jgi:hypothetical protein
LILNKNSINDNDITIPKNLNLQSSLNTLRTNIDTKQNIMNDNDLTVPKILNLQSSLNTVQTNIDTKQNAINDNDLTIPKNLNLQSSLTILQDNIDLNTSSISTKQATITSSTGLECNSILTPNNYNVNGVVNIDTNPYYNTILTRRPTDFSGDITYYLGVRELQCWVNNSNIFFDNANDLISYYALWSDKETASRLHARQSPVDGAAAFLRACCSEGRPLSLAIGLKSPWAA